MSPRLIEHRPAARFCCLVLVIFCATVCSLGAGEWGLTVKGEVKSPLNLNMEAIKAMPVSAVTAEENQNGKPVVYEGVNLHEILHQAGIPEGEALKGSALRLCVLVKAADGYCVVFSLAELDPMLGGKRVLLAIRSNGTELDSKSGPARIVVADEKRHARWVRQVTELEVIRLEPDHQSSSGPH